VVLSLWKKEEQFPIRFKTLECFKEHDESEQMVESLHKLTPLINDIFEEINAGSK